MGRLNKNSKIIKWGDVYLAHKNAENRTWSEVFFEDFAYF